MKFQILSFDFLAVDIETLRPYSHKRQAFTVTVFRLANETADEICRMCRDLFPSSKCLFLYRDVVATAKSVRRMSFLYPSLHIVNLFGFFSDQMTKVIAEWLGMNGSVFCVRLDNDLILGALFYAISTSRYLDMRRRGFDISALRYEDLVARPVDMCRLILEFCHLPVLLAELAVKALDVDSQRNSGVAKSIIGRIKDPELTPEKKAKLNELLTKYGLPLIGEPNVLEGTLSCS